MTDKYFFLNADDFGLSKEHNQAVLYGYKTGFLKHTSLIVNTLYFDDVINNIIPVCPKLNIGLHLNIMEGKSLTKCPMLTDNKGNFNRSYLYYIFNQNNKKLLAQIEKEFEAQIIKALNNNIKIFRLDSHVHVHGIPEIFRITCKLANKYNIPYVRTQFEKPYFCKSKRLKLINLIKVILLQFFTKINQKVIKKHNLKTNSYILGIGYTAMMSQDTIQAGLRNLNCEIIECIIHPCKYENKENNSHAIEFGITQNLDLKTYIENIDYKITNFF